MTASTDVSTAQSFDVNSFFAGLFGAAATAVAANNTKPSQNNGQPSATTQPNVTALPGGYVSSDGSGIGGISTKTIVIGVVAAVVAAVIIKKVL